MSIVVLLIGFSILIAGGFLAAFLWAVKTDQYLDTESPAMRMLFDEPVRDSSLEQSQSIPKTKPQTKSQALDQQGQ